MRTKTRASLWCCLAALMISGCQGDWFKRRLDEAPESDASVSDRPASKAIEGTIGSVAYLRGMRKMAVRGYGLVVGLGQNGSSDCPPQIRKYMVQQIGKRRRVGTLDAGTISPDRLLSDLDTAVVQVTGEIGAAAHKGSQFDVYVRSLPRTQTQSLVGGRLYTCDLKLPGTGGLAKLAEERTLATGYGRVFVNPFVREQDAVATASLTNGAILGGGTVLVDRRLQLILFAPSYQTAGRIRDRINERFPKSRKVADAAAPSQVGLRIPAEWVDREEEFLALVMHLYLYDDPASVERLARELAEELLDPDGAHEDVVWAWRGIGRSALPVIRPLYAHHSRRVSFHAAVAGYCLDDSLAIETLARHAGDEGSPYRLQAIEALGYTKRGAAASVLETLLADPAQPVRLAAYEQLREMGSTRVLSVSVGGDNFVLDVVECDGPALIWASRAAESRIAVLGVPLWCVPPIFYLHPDEILTVSADEGAEQLTLIRRTRGENRRSPAIHVSRAVDRFIQFLGGEPIPGDDGKIMGLGLSYSETLEVVAQMCRDGAIPASFVLAEPTRHAILTPEAPGERPESEF